MLPPISRSLGSDRERVLSITGAGQCSEGSVGAHYGLSKENPCSPLPIGGGETSHFLGRKEVILRRNNGKDRPNLVKSGAQGKFCLSNTL